MNESEYSEALRVWAPAFQGACLQSELKHLLPPWVYVGLVTLRVQVPNNHILS